MEHNIIWTERASQDIEALVRYIARRNPSAGARIGEGIFERAQILKTHPDAGSIFSVLRSGEWRKLVFKRWIIIYRLRFETVIIGRVWPAAKGDPDLHEPI